MADYSKKNSISELQSTESYAPSKLATRIHEEYSKLQDESPQNSSSSTKTPLDLSKGSQLHYTNFQPHNFLTQDLTNNLEEFGHNPLHQDKSYKSTVQSILDRTKTPKWKLNKQNIVLTHSEDTANTLLIHSLCEEGDHIIVTLPGNPRVSAIARAHGVIVKEISLQCQKDPKTGEITWEYDLDMLTKIITADVRFIYMLNPNWQIGKLVSDKKIKSMIKICEEKGLLIVVDETYIDYQYPDKKIHRFGDIALQTPVISINSSTNQFGMGGNCIAWLVLYGDKDCFEDLKNILRVSNSGNFYETDIQTRTSLETCFLSNEQTGYPKEKMKLVTMRNKHFQNVWPTNIGMGLGLANAAFNNVIHVDWNAYSDFNESTSEICKKLAEEQNQWLMPGESFGGADLLRYDNCISIQVFNDMVERLKEFSAQNSTAFQP